jgi:flagellar protein FliO/FliZ
MDSLAQVGRLLLSLAFVLGVMWLIARRVRKSPTRVRNTKLIDVVGRQQLTKSSSIAVVRVLDQALVVGITDGHVSVLGEADLAKVEAQLEAVAPQKAPLRLRAQRPATTADGPATQRPLPPRRPVPTTHTVPENHGAPTEQIAPSRKPALAGSALSPATWRATVDSIRDLTVRTR